MSACELSMSIPLTVPAPFNTVRTSASNNSPNGQGAKLDAFLSDLQYSVATDNDFNCKDQNCVS